MLGCPGAEPQLPPVQGWFWFAELNATVTAGTAALQELEPSCLLGILGQASWEEKSSICPRASPLPCLALPASLPGLRLQDKLCPGSVALRPAERRLQRDVYTCTAVCIHLRRGYLPATGTEPSCIQQPGWCGEQSSEPQPSISPGPS